MQRYPHTIENGGGERLTFLGVVCREDGERLECEAFAEPGAGPPMHVHHLQEEAMTVVEGKIGTQVLGEEPRFAGPGETVVFAPGVAHRWWNAGTTTLHCTGWARPPHNVEYFLSALFDSTKRNGGKRPGMFDIAYLVTRYGSEFGVIEGPPPFVRKVMFPVFLTVGKVLGKHRKFDGAPEPIRETK